jgi:hypothetical protein
MSSAAIVILNYNGREMLETFLPSVIANSHVDIWVIDNNSVDDSIPFLEEKFPQIQVLKSSQNLGYAGGYNWGLDQLRNDYDYHILLNSDVEVTKNWDIDLVRALEVMPDYAAIQPKILSWTSKNKFDYAGAGGGFVDAYGYPYCRGRIMDQIEQDSGQYDDSIDVDWASGACFIVRSEVFHQFDGFDASFFAHMEEIDLCWRLRKSGWKIGYKGDISVYHLGGGTLQRSSPHKLYLNIRNSLSMIYKNESTASFEKIYWVKYLLEHLAILSYRIKGQKELAKAIRRGYTDFTSIKKSLRKFQTPICEGKEIKSKSPVTFLVWQWVVLRKKKFSAF